MIANVYIDGFNLYYGALKKTSYKWLDLSAMCQKLLPSRQIGRIRYFTARIQALPQDMQAPSRQNDYLRALTTIPNLTIHYGHFVSRPQTWPIYPVTYPSPSGPPQMAQILRTEEKRSDVNLATLLLVDCAFEAFDEAVIISNDSDLALPVECAVQRFGKTAGVINPQRYGKPSENWRRSPVGRIRESIPVCFPTASSPRSLVPGMPKSPNPPRGNHASHLRVDMLIGPP